MKGGISLISFIEEVKNELKRGRSEDPFFELDEVTLEVSFVLDITAKGDAKFLVVNVGGQTKAQQTHKVRLKLFPLGDSDKEEPQRLPTKGRPIKKKRSVRKGPSRPRYAKK